MNTQERLKQFLAHMKLTHRKFQSDVGLSNGFVSKVGNHLHEDNLRKIKATYPLLNLIWLETGIGNMIEQETIIRKIEENQEDSRDLFIRMLQKMISEKDEKIEKLQKQLGVIEYIEKISEKKNKENQ